MSFYSNIFTANYKRFFTRLKKVSQEENRCFICLTVDAAWSAFRYGVGLTDYMVYRFHTRSRKERKEYVGTRDAFAFYKIATPADCVQRFLHKPIFLRDFAAFTNRDYLVPEESSYEAFEEFIRKHETFMAKPAGGSFGHGIQKIHAKDIADPKAYFEQCAADHVYFEELVVQHPHMDQLCPVSVNTLRVMTYYNHGEPIIVWMGMRIGTGNTVVDNFNSGGVIIAIDQEKGCLKGTAQNKLGQVYTTHPLTGVRFDGFSLPYFDQIKELVVKAAKLESNVQVIGWDIAITADGPVVIEGNCHANFDAPQVADNRGHRDIVDFVLSDMKKA